MKTTLPYSLIWGMLLVAGCGGKDDGSAVEGKLAGQNLLLITLDTTRADRIGAYGYKPAKTPTLDALAASGTLFEQAYAQAPLTLPSHCSMMTGRYPREHGVRDNGRNALGKSLPTLAETFKKNGYATGAFVASFVLDSRFGIDRGFDIFRDEMDQVSFRTQPLEWQQPASVVADRALEWLPSMKDKPFFAWVHFYDAHEAYAPPEPFSGPDVLPYDGELAYIDSQVKRLTDWVQAAGLAGKTLIVVVGDHGEAFGEHEENGHSDFVYDENLHVPLWFSHPTAIPKQRRIPALVEILDMYPTLLRLFGWEAPEGLMSRSLTPAFVDGKLADAEIYAESMFVYYSFHWAEQRSLLTRDWKYISSTKPELYHRADDPNERDNLAAKDSRTAEKLRKKLRERWESMVPGQAADAELDPETLRKLRSLGYMGGKTGPAKEEFLTDGLPDPKSHRATILKLRMGKALMERAKTPEDTKWVIPLLEHVVSESPRSQIFHVLLGAACLKARELERASAAFKEAVKLDPTNAEALSFLAQALVRLRRIPEALEHFEAAVRLDDLNSDAHFRYAEGLMVAGQTERAVEEYRRAIDLFPDFAEGHVKLGQALKQLNLGAESTPHFAKASQLLKDAIAKNPDDAELRFRLGAVLVGTDRSAEAIEQLRGALAINPKDGPTLVFLAAALEAHGDLTEAESVILQATTNDEVAAEAFHALGVLRNKTGHEAQAVEAYETAISLQPTRRLAVQELVGFYLKNRRVADALRILRVGADNALDNPVFQNMAAKILATSTNDAIRDGSAAIQYANRANQLTGDNDPSVIATVAAAHAENGDFPKAIELAVRATEIAQKSGQDAIVKLIAAQMDEYKQGKPIRDPRF